MNRRVVVTGMGITSPVGTSVPVFWDNLLLGKSGTGKITRFDAGHLPYNIAAEITDWDISEDFTPKEIRKKDRLSLYALKSAGEAWESAQIKDIDPERAGVIWASGNGGIDSLESGLDDHLNSGARFSPFYIPRILLDTPAGEIAMKFGLKGINFATVSACASSNNALMDALNYIRWGKADLIVAGGSEAPITRALIGGFGSMKALSTNTGSASSASRPFDVDRDGFVMGEGSGALVLESLDHALKRSAPIICELAGAACNNDAFHPTATHPEGIGAAKAMNLALEDASLKPEDVDFINLHATSTKVGDLSEINALKIVFGGNSKPYLSASKSVTGHLLGAAGAIEAVAAVKSVQTDLIPPTMHIKQLDPAFPTDQFALVQEKTRSARVNVAMSNNFGFGGHNTIVIFKKY